MSKNYALNKHSIYKRATILLGPANVLFMSSDDILPLSMQRAISYDPEQFKPSTLNIYSDRAAMAVRPAYVPAGHPLQRLVQRLLLARQHMDPNYPIEVPWGESALNYLRYKLLPEAEIMDIAEIARQDTSLAEFLRKRIEKFGPTVFYRTANPPLRFPFQVLPVEGGPKRLLLQTVEMDKPYHFINEMTKNMSLIDTPHYFPQIVTGKRRLVKTLASAAKKLV